MPLQNPGSTVKLTEGTYTGDDSVNRAIPHGLGKIPSKLIMQNQEVNTARGEYVFLLLKGLARISCYKGGASSSLAVTAMNITNFYVGNATAPGMAANGNTIPYGWVAIG